MDPRTLQKLIAPMARRLTNMLARGKVDIVNAASKMQTIQAKLLTEEIKAGMEHFEPYGFTSHPKRGAEVITAFFDGDRSHGIVICAADRRYRLAGLAEGEVALYDDQGQTIVIKRDMIEITSATKVRLVTPLLEVTGDIIDRCDDQPNTMANMRLIYDTHTHNETGTITEVPNQLMI